MKALSIKQPWAWLIANGFKDIENRSWHTDFRGKFFIHAPLKPMAFDLLRIQKMLSAEDYKYFASQLNNIPIGGIVGIADITDCVKEHDSKWFEGHYGFVIKNAQPLTLIPHKGQLKFFEIDDCKVIQYVCNKCGNLYYQESKFTRQNLEQNLFENAFECPSCKRKSNM